MNIVINGESYENTFLVVRGLNLEVILGNDFLIRNNAVINFKKRILELNNEGKQMTVNFEWVLDTVKISGIRVIPNRVIDRDIEFSMNMCKERVSDESEERIWADRAVKFCGEGGAMGSSQRKALWRVVENYRGVFAGEPGRAKGYECELKVSCLLYTSRCV